VLPYGRYLVGCGVCEGGCLYGRSPPGFFAFPTQRPDLELPALRLRVRHASVVQDVVLLGTDMRHPTCSGDGLPMQGRNCKSGFGYRRLEAAAPETPLRPIADCSRMCKESLVLILSCTQSTARDHAKINPYTCYPCTHDEACLGHLAKLNSFGSLQLRQKKNEPRRAPTRSVVNPPDMPICPVFAEKTISLAPTCL
jgi:hypothetical protein